MKILLWIFVMLCLTVPVSFLISAQFEMPIGAILSAIWGLASGFIATKVVL